MDFQNGGYCMDKTPSVIKPVHLQFRAAQSLTSREIARLTPTHHPHQPNKPSYKILSASTPAAPISEAVPPVLTMSGQNPENLKSCAQGGTSVRPVSDQRSGELKLSVKKAASRLSKRPPKLEFRMSETQKEIVKERASQLGMTLTDFAKVMLIDEVYDPSFRQALLRLYRQLSGIATNITQATASLHRDGDHTGYVAALQELTRPLLDTLKGIRAALARNGRGTTP
jgi:hypothetical protein